MLDGMPSLVLKSEVVRAWFVPEEEHGVHGEPCDEGRDHCAHSGDALQCSNSMQLDPVAQSLFNHAKAPCGRCQCLARLNKSNRLLLELKREPAPLPIPHLRFPFAIKAAR